MGEENINKTEGKSFPFEKVFVIFSIIFFLMLAGFYGSRFYQYEKKKAADNAVYTLAEKLFDDARLTAKGEKLYGQQDAWIFRGSNEYNYLRYGGLLWRIMQINADGSVKLISARPVNDLAFDDQLTGFADSDVYQWLNGCFLDQLDKSLLVETACYADEVSDLSAVRTENSVKVMVGLCDLVSYANSYLDGESYLGEGSFWLANVSDTGVYRTEAGGLTVSPAERFYGVRPVITLSAEATAPEGTGSINDPYHFKEEGVTIGTGIIPYVSYRLGYIF